MGDTLLPWMKAFALWYLSPQPDGKKPKTPAQTKKATELAGYLVTKNALYKMRGRPDFQLFLNTLRTSVTDAAKEALTLAHLAYVKAHERGLEMALAHGDYKAIPAFTVPVLDRIVPKKADTNVGNKTIIVNVQEGAARALLGSAEETLGEIIVEPVVEQEDGESGHPV